MFSARTENILLNYFLVLLTVGLSFIISSSPAYLFLLLFLFSLGLFLLFDKYYFFKITFVPTIMLAIFLEFFILDANMIFIIILFISLAQICILLSYLTLFVSLLLTFEIFNLSLLIPIFLLALLFSLFSGFGKIKREMSRKLFTAETRHLLFKHELCNLYSIVFLKNKDENLKPTLEKIRKSFDFKTESSKSSIAGLLRMSVYLQDYNYNLSIKENFFIYGSNFSWMCFFCILFEKYVKKGSNVFVSKKEVVFVLKKDFRKKELDDFLKTQFVNERVSVENGVLKFYYGR